MRRCMRRRNGKSFGGIRRYTVKKISVGISTDILRRVFRILTEAIPIHIRLYPNEARAHIAGSVKL